MSKHLYECEPDARQGGDIAVSRFRPQYRALTDEEKDLHDQIKQKACEMEALIEHIAPGRYRALALTDLESAVMWAVKELTGPRGIGKG